MTGRLGVRAAVTRNASSAATEIIREAIVNGRLAPGVRLKEEELARELGLSRTPVREALLVLQSEGMVESSANRGASVRRYDASELEDIYELRAVLEGLAAHRAGQHVTAREITQMRRSCERFDKLVIAEDVQALIKENLYWHNCVLAAARSERLPEMVRKVIELPLVYKSFIWFSREQRLNSERYHRDITDALADHDPERAEQLMRSHVFQARDFLVAQARSLREEDAEAVADVDATADGAADGATTGASA